ncbi:class I adenylate-forming enzyme family protein [Allokutzneria albata]|uniref:Acyl-CoA synthetase (AMP-forming)/AMP-acid ligase II n=1 Tax=Allokutzneria albata TaxID=211114 RepID=A0A1G9TGB8_ALLAB|nr:class I adenylate-forming enzyme family protein [Allokutzneria albata]SDM46544.1 Acyl-CoA synthetase (AMP-forming)/AMP-acid ligase II [Allokutzneria albata]
MTASALHPLSRVLEFTARGWWVPDTLDELFRRQVRARPGALAVVDSSDKAELTGIEPRRWSWARLHVEVDRLAALLQRHGVGPGDIVAVQLPSCVELVATFLAVVRLGGVVCPIPVQYREYELRALLPLAGARTLVTATRINGRRYAEFARQVCGEAVTVLAFGANVPRRVVQVDAAEHVVPVRSYEADPNHCVSICWTSGTEGTPKAVPRAHYDWLAIARACAEAAALTADDVILSPFPLVNVAGIGASLVPWLLSGCRLVLHQPVALAALVRQLSEEHVTCAVVPPAVLAALARWDVPSLRTVVAGSGPLSPVAVRDCPAPVVSFFASCEGTVLFCSPKDVADPEARARLFPRSGAMRMRLVDPVTEREIVESGRPGELRVAGPTVIPGYLLGTGDDPFDDLGFLRTGDLFEFAGPGGRYLRYVDRVRDVIVRQGARVVPSEVEAVLVAHAGVAEAAVVGDADGKACAFVVAGGAVSGDDLAVHLRGYRVEVPERFEFVDALPRNFAGRVVRRELRRRL